MVNVLNPMAKKFKPESNKSPPQNDTTEVSLPHAKAMDVCQKETVHRLKSASTQHFPKKQQQQENKIIEISQYFQHDSTTTHSKEE